jgi:hypothetical protein
MAPVISSAILGTIVVATIAVSVASASFINSHDAAPKADRLPIALTDNSYVTFETHHNDGVSVLTRVQVN